MGTSDISAVSIDPRDTVQEIDSPAYRVYFIEPDDSTEEFRLVGVQQVESALAWARDDGRHFDLFAEYPTSQGTGLVLLYRTSRAPLGDPPFTESA